MSINYVHLCVCVCVCWPGLAVDFLQDYLQVNMGSMDLCANPNIRQIVEVCEDREKDSK